MTELQGTVIMMCLLYLAIDKCIDRMCGNGYGEKRYK